MCEREREREREEEEGGEIEYSVWGILQPRRQKNAVQNVFYLNLFGLTRVFVLSVNFVFLTFQLKKVELKIKTLSCLAKATCIFYAHQSMLNRHCLQQLLLLLIQ